MKYNDYYLLLPKGTGRGKVTRKAQQIQMQSFTNIFEFYLLRQEKRVGIKSSCSQVVFLPVMIVRGQDHTWAGVGIACDPGTVDCKHHQQHQHQHGNNAFYIRT